jgi:predicted DNA binding CopG/RHH family protein
MQPSSQAALLPRSASFAGLLAALASSPTDATDPSPASIPAWSSDDLGEEVASLSYERALRAHARYKPADRGDGTGNAAAGAEAQPATVAVPPTTANFDHLAGVEAAETAQAAAEPERRSASVTIRLSTAECALLRRRAAEAGVTVSAYLRSCTLEADALRAEVKQALAEMRTAGLTRRMAAKAPTRCSWIGCLARVFSRRKLVN